MKTREIETFYIHESKNSEKVLQATQNLEAHCSLSYAKKIRKAQENGQLYGLYFTKSHRLKAVFI
jgi:hypothetical protein